MSKNSYQKKYFAAQRKVKLPVVFVLLFAIITQLSLLSITFLFLSLQELLATRSTLWYVIGLLVALLMFFAFLDYLLGRLIHRLYYRYEGLFTPLLYNQLFRVESNMSKGKKGADNHSVFARYGLLRDMVQVRDFQLQGCLKALVNLCGIPLWMGMALWLDIEAGIMLIALTILMFIVLRLNIWLNISGQARAEAVASATLDKLEIARNAGRTMLSMGLYANMRQIWVLSRAREALLHIQQANKIHFFQSLVKLLYLAGIAITPIIVSSNDLSNYGLLLAVLWVAIFIARPLVELSDYLRPWLKTKIQQPRINKHIRMPQTSSNHWARELKGDFQLKNLKITIPGVIDPVLRVDNLTIRSGETLGIIGNIGSGKSMLCKLLAGIENYDGNLILDGIEYRDWDKELLGTHVGYLPQEIDLLPGTVSENICRFSSNARDEDIRHVARLAGADEHINNLEKSYATEISVGDDAIPYGLKQRIAIARSFFGMPQVVILDAVTAQLDQRALFDIRNSVLELKKLGKTIIVATHSRSFLEITDRIAILHDCQLAAVDDSKNIISNM